MNIFLSITQRTPKCYGLTYLALIPAYSAIYYFCPETLNEEKSPLGCLYFSIITITTLGYGDILPVGWAGQVAAASEALFGVILIGLFLNSVANARGDAVRAEQEEKENRSLIRGQRARLNGHYMFIQPIIERYKLSVTDIIRPDGISFQPYSPDFRVNDMKDMYRPCIKDFRFRPVIVVHCEIVNQLHKEIIDLVKSVDLRYFPEIGILCQQLSEAISDIDPPRQIMSPLQDLLMPLQVRENGDETMIEHMRDMMENYEGDYTYEQGHLMNGYIFLYKQTKILMELLPCLQAVAEKEIDGPK